MTQSVPQNPSRRHHYIPQFYLKRWTTHGTLVVYSRNWRGKIIAKPTSTKATGFECDLYTVPGLPRETADLVEREFMAGIDQNADRIIGRLIDGELPFLTLMERVHVARLLTSFILRNPEAVARLKANLAQMLYEPSEWLSAEYARRRTDDDPETIEEFAMRNMPDLPTAYPLTVLQTLINHRRIVPTIASLFWRVIDVSSAPQALLTSDRPIVMSNGLARTDGHFALPLNPSKIFLATWTREFGEYVGAQQSRLLVSRANHLVAGQARRFVYGVDTSRRAWVERRISTLDHASWVGPTSV